MRRRKSIVGASCVLVMMIITLLAATVAADAAAAEAVKAMVARGMTTAIAQVQEAALVVINDPEGCVHRWRSLLVCRACQRCHHGRTSV